MTFKIKPNPNNEKYNKMTKAVQLNKGYCPCMVEQSEDTKCICKDFREQDYEGLCHCERFIKIKSEEEY
jgi:hypothetical protein